MKKENINTMERFLILFDKFINKLIDSELPENVLVEQSYLFCSGFYIKFQSEINKIQLSNRDMVLTFLLTSYFCYKCKVKSRFVDPQRIKKMCDLLTNFIIKNQNYTEQIFLNEKRKYEKNTIGMTLLSKKDGINKSMNK
jgi:hypothetical protein